MPDNLLNLFKNKPTRSQQSISIEKNLALHYRSDLPGQLETSEGFTHHLLTVFITANEQQTTHIDRVGEHNGRMEKGEFYLYPAETSGFTRWQAEDETLHIIIRPNLLHKVAIETECPNSDRLELLPVLKNYDPQIDRLTQLLVAEMQNDCFGGQLYLKSLSDVLAIHLLRNYCVFKSVFRQYADDGLAPHKLRRVIDYIEAYLDTDLSLEAMAKQIGMSRYYFASQFKQAMGISPYQYVIRQRIKRARKLLESRLSLLQIALDCGFASQSHLNKVFRQYVGTTPKKYREKL